MQLASSTLSDVQRTVHAIERDRLHFGISDAELYDRRAFVETSRNRIERAKRQSQVRLERTMDMDTTSRQQCKQQSPYDVELQSDAAMAQSSSQAQAAARTSLLMEHQDETLDELDAAAQRVGHMASTIHEEIGLQNQMLTELQDDLEHVEDELGLVMGKVARLLKTKNGCQLGLIVSLFCIMVVLLMLVLYT
jgi:syntaxin 6